MIETVKCARDLANSKLIRSKKFLGRRGVTQLMKRAQFVLTILRRIKSAKSCQIVDMNTIPSALISGSKPRSGAPFAMRMLFENS